MSNQDCAIPSSRSSQLTGLRIRAGWADHVDERERLTQALFFERVEIVDFYENSGIQRRRVERELRQRLSGHEHFRQPSHIT